VIFCTYESSYLYYNSFNLLSLLLFWVIALLLFFFLLKIYLNLYYQSDLFYCYVYQKLPMEIICVNLCIYLVIFFLTVTKNTSSILTVQIHTILRISCHKWVSQNKSFLLIPLHIKFVKSCKSHVLERKLSFDSN